jgi:hypothetical protein
MRLMFRWAFRLLILLVILAVAAILLKDTLLKSMVEGQIRAETGLEVKIGKLELGLFAPTLTIENFRLFNNAEFGGSPFLEVPELYVEYDRKTLGSNRLHLLLVRLNLAELHVVKNQAGQSNLEALQIMEKLLSGRFFGTLAFGGIDVLNLSVGQVKYSSMNQPNQVRQVKVGIQNEIIKNLQTTQALSSLALRILLQNGKDLFLKSGP